MYHIKLTFTNPNETEPNKQPNEKKTANFKMHFERLISISFTTTKNNIIRLC